MRDGRHKLKHAIECFEALCRECSSSGKKLTISAVASMAGVDRKYFYGRINTPHEDLRRCWQTLGEDIKKFNLSQQSLVRNNIVGSSSTGDKLHNALVENYGLVESIEQLKSIRTRLELQLSQMREKIDVLEDRNRVLEVKLTTSPSGSGPIVAFNNKRVIVSPDRWVDGSDQLSRTKAWVAAMKELKSVLSRPLEKNLYVTIGIPGSGKTTWCSKMPASNRLPIVLDACNITRSDRFEVLDIASSYRNVRCIAVAFYVSLETAINRNSVRAKAERVPHDKIASMYESIEYPGLFDDLETFDEIIMVRS